MLSYTSFVHTNGSASFLGKSYERINDGSVSWKTQGKLLSQTDIVFNLRLCASDDPSSGFTSADCSTFTEPLTKEDIQGNCIIISVFTSRVQTVQ